MRWAASGRSSTLKKEAPGEPRAAAKPLVFNEDLLPPLTDLLAELQLEKYLSKVVRMGVAETRHLLRLGPMDFRIMSMDWDITAEELLRLRTRIEELIALATVAEGPPQDDTLLRERSALKYGRVYMRGSVMSFEYLSATFGAAAPVMGALRVAISEPPDGCGATHPDLSGAVLVVKRGNCSFLGKAVAAVAANATALIIVNTEDRLDAPSSGVGIDPNVTDAMHNSVSKLAVVCTSNNSFAKFVFAARRERDTAVHIVPLRCVSGGKCAPVTEAERGVPTEVASGRLAVAALGGLEQELHVDFLTSTFGGTLPTGALRLLFAEGAGLACDPFSRAFLESIGADNGPFALLVRRGGCRFDDKAAVVESSGAALMVVVDPQDGALQRLGGGARSGEVGMPSVLVPSPLADFASSLRSQPLLLTLYAHEGPEIADEWIDVALTTFAEDAAERRLQTEGLVQRFLQSGKADIVAWLRRQDLKWASTSREEL